MYEPEVTDRNESIQELPAGIRRQFEEFRGRIEARSLLPWGEHCTECSWPSCYSSCELYSPREDSNCRLFVDGMVRVDGLTAFNSYLLKIQFKRWGKLWAPATMRLYSPSSAKRLERANMAIGRVARAVPLPQTLKSKSLARIGSVRRRIALSLRPSVDLPTSFLFECYNPGDSAIDFTLAVQNRPQEAAGLYQIDQPNLFQKLIRVQPGFNRARVAVREMLQRVNLRKPFNVEIVPNQAENRVFYFGALDFIKESERAAQGKAPGESSQVWKCIVWDLDNTLWQGTLIEDGPESLQIREGIADVIRTTDRRGILHSIASKNNFDDAMAVLKRSGLDEYFLHPQINWEPKSQSVSRIAQLLNIGLSSMAFVDDQAFEREEVASALPEVTVLDASRFRQIPEMPECNVPVTEESKKRRMMYREQEQRESVLQDFQGDYREFLKTCEMRLSITQLAGENLERVYELAQRTNQMNFSGNRYPREQLRKIMASEIHDTFVMSCDDKFGQYGIVGFAVVDKREPRLLDLMFSCRVQSKRVEHAFLAFLLRRYIGSLKSDFHANYRKTKKNAPSGRVFTEMNFSEVEVVDDITRLVFTRNQEIPDEELIRIMVAEEEMASPFQKDQP